MANKYERLQCPLNLNHPEHKKLYEYVMEETGGIYIAEYLRSLIRLHKEGKLISSQLSLVSLREGTVEDQEVDDSYLKNLVL